ncbi:hypothetical protein ONE63_006294 [Megalurothrips usitatus]|uniref:BHLH domain-containing protein n=1 Tax=Megalurothrips usitatus TaxID=439358 RepID=A0AAV7XWY5_9NEOP|nr:hypothetical protein ONE63_006294 [Megalurothrips usitatus]
MRLNNNNHHMILAGDDNSMDDGLFDGDLDECGSPLDSAGPAGTHHPLQRNAANARERARMRVLSKAFCRLKTTLPWVPADTKLSKLDTLRLATSYIAYLREALVVPPGEAPDGASPAAPAAAGAAPANPSVPGAGPEPWISRGASSASSGGAAPSATSAAGSGLGSGASSNASSSGADDDPHLHDDEGVEDGVDEHLLARRALSGGRLLGLQLQQPCHYQPHAVHAVHQQQCFLQRYVDTAGHGGHGHGGAL